MFRSLTHLFNKLNKNNLIRPNIKEGIKNGIFGHVDSIDENGIWGWFVNIDKPDDKNLSVFINNKYAGNISNFFFRADIEKIARKRVNAGFFVNWEDLNIDQELLSTDKWEIAVIHNGTGKKIAGRDKLLEEKVSAVQEKLKKNNRIAVKKLKIPAVDLIEGNIDKVEIKGNTLTISGWIFHKKNPIKKLNLIVENKTYPVKYGIERRDVFEIFKSIFSLKSGFTAEFTIKKLGIHKIFLDVELDGGNLKLELGEIQIDKIEKNNWSSCEFYMLEDVLKYFKNTENFLTKKLPEPVDIIIPVFNGYRYIGRLFNSIFKNTNGDYRLIVIDDCSTDYRTVEFLNRISKERENIILIRNEKNRGFVYSANKGFELAKNHVVLLNTDVELPPDWLYRLMKPIFENDEIASTTPFTNAGMICSFPEFLKDNEIPDDMDVETVDKVFSSFTVDDCIIELPTAVGFCMGINKNALKKVGFFNEKLFGKGYGEENDWCMRARNLGYKNILVQNLFVYHKHGGSFSDKEKENLLQKHLNILNSIYPEYQKLVEDFIREDPAKLFRETAGLFLFGKNRETMLIIDHNIGGGANIYRENLIKERLKEDMCVLLYTEEYFSNHSKLQCRYNKHSFEFRVKDFGSISNIVKELNISEIFLNNLVSYEKPLEILKMVKQIKDTTGAKLIVPIHDYFCICPSYNLINNKGVYCEVPQEVDVCKNCLKENFYSEKPEIKDIKLWRNGWEEIINTADKILCFSNSSREILLRAYPKIDKEKILVLPHKLDVILRKVKTKRVDNTINVAVIGNINYQKGAKVIAQLLNKIHERNLPINLHVIGIIDTSSFEEQIMARLNIHGSYNRSDLPDIMEKLNIHIVLFPSIWPETFSYVVEEVMSMELPIISFDIGAQAEKLKNYPKGIVVKYMDVDSILGKITGLRGR